MRLLKIITPLVILLYFSSCNKEFNKEELELIKVGDTKEMLVSKVGEPIELQNIERWIYEGNNTIFIHKGKVNDYFIAPGHVDNYEEISVHTNGDTVIAKSFNDIRIGMSNEEVEEIVGLPKKEEKIEIIYYKNHQKIIVQNGVIESIDLHAFQDLSILDKIRLNFNSGGMIVINFSLAIIMFGVALGIRLEHFTEVLKHPKSMIIGVFSQFIALPALTFLLILIMKPTASVAFGMILVAASPGGNISNFMTSFAKGNSALSISLTAFATLAAIFMTPLNFSFWGNLYSGTSDFVVPIQIDPYQMVKTVLILLGIPVVLGLVFRHFFEDLSVKIEKPLRIFSIIFFLGLVVGAMSLNFEFMVRYLHLIVLMVFIHNLLALLTGYSLARIFKLPKIDRRTLSIETGIQNSGLALVLIFNPKLFDGIGGMAFIAGGWGIWHIISGLTVASVWRRIKT
ncbi:MAG: bile acid:sodium symporter family protein [Bacteroidota bacterium]